jgi:hypothetical protein
MDPSVLSGNNRDRFILKRIKPLVKLGSPFVQWFVENRLLCLKFRVFCQARELHSGEGHRQAISTPAGPTARRRNLKTCDLPTFHDKISTIFLELFSLWIV